MYLHPEGSRSSERASEPTDEQLSGVLSEFARTMLTDFAIQAILDRLVARIVEILPISGAGVTLIARGADPEYVAASSEAALRFEQLQAELGEGPCVEAYGTGHAVEVVDLGVDTRFPAFSPRAVEAGLVAVSTFPLRDGAERLGALDLYRDEPGPLDAKTVAAAQTLADVAAAYLLNAQARADLQESTARSHRLALHDALTGLPNRTLLLERLDRAVVRAARSEKFVAVMFADLDGFKVINDLHGHGAGDELLVAVARRMAGALRAGDTLARMSGDEFVVLCEDLDDLGTVDVLAKRLIDLVAEPFELSGVDVRVTISIGIAFSGSGDRPSEDVLKDADEAMYQGKRKGGASHQVLDVRAQSVSRHHERLEHDLRGAIERGEMRTVYQPIVATVDGLMIGVEALVRWDHPTRGVVSPVSLVPLAEQAGLIGELGRWVLAQACTDLGRWNAERRHHPLKTFVNLSAQQLMSRDLTSTVRDVLEETNIDPGLLTLEVTESVFEQDRDRAFLVLSELKRIGVHLALDDFGTGYSSLSRLNRFPIDIVKIDQSFVADLERESASRPIVRAVIDLVHALGMRAIGEGVETAAQREQLEDLGCDWCQGHFFAHPMSADRIVALCEQRAAGDEMHLPEIAA